MDDDTAKRQIAEAADRLFYAHGIRAVGMDAIRDASGVSLKRAYRLYPAKDQLAEAVLRRRAGEFHAELVAHTTDLASPHERILAVFDHLHDVLSAPDYRGCPFINAFGEGHGGGVLDAVTDGKRDLAAFIGDLVAEARGSETLAAQLTILVNGAMVTGSILGASDAALDAKAAARALLGLEPE
jgi:AcrR family transcriptional regulator